MKLDLRLATSLVGHSPARCSRRRRSRSRLRRRLLFYDRESERPRETGHERGSELGLLGYGGGGGKLG